MILKIVVKNRDINDMEKKVYNINELYDIIKDYSSKLHKTTFRYGIDYIKCDPYLKEKYLEIFKELEEYIINKKGVFICETISDSNYPARTLIEVGNKYELETMIAVPKATIIPIDENSSKIEDLTWVLLEDLSENEINDYKNKLRLTLNVVDYDWLNENQIDVISKLLGVETTTDKFIDNLKSNNYNNTVSTITKLELEDRLILADKFNLEIRKDCLNTNETEIERCNWLDSLSVIPNKLLTITHNKNIYKIYI